MPCAIFWTHVCVGGGANGTGEERMEMAVLEINDLTVDFETEQGLCKRLIIYVERVPGRSSAWSVKVAVARRPWRAAS
jgi:hypothetical protein